MGHISTTNMTTLGGCSLIRTQLVINAITRPKWNKSQNGRLNTDCLIKQPCMVALID